MSPELRLENLEGSPSPGSAQAASPHRDFSSFCTAKEEPEAHSTPSLHSAPPPAADTYLFIHWHLPGVFLPLVKLCQLFLHPFSTHWEISPTTAQFPADQRCVNSGIMLFKCLTKKTKTPKKKPGSEHSHISVKCTCAISMQ